jgi:hypothetical protein
MYTGPRPRFSPFRGSFQPFFTLDCIVLEDSYRSLTAIVHGSDQGGRRWGQLISSFFELRS